MQGKIKNMLTELPIPPTCFVPHFHFQKIFCLPKQKGLRDSHHQSHGVPPSSVLQPRCHSLKFPKDLPILWTNIFLAGQFLVLCFNRLAVVSFESTNWKTFEKNLHWDVVLPNLIEFQHVFTILNVQLLATKKSSWNCDLCFTMTVSFAGGPVFYLIHCKCSLYLETGWNDWT